MERSVRFNVEDEVVVETLPLKGEEATGDEEVKHLTANEPEKHVDIITFDAENPIPIDNPIPEANEGRGKHMKGN